MFKTTILISSLLTSLFSFSQAPTTLDINGQTGFFPSFQIDISSFVIDNGGGVNLQSFDLDPSTPEKEHYLSLTFSDASYDQFSGLLTIFSQTIPCIAAQFICNYTIESNFNEISNQSILIGSVFETEYEPQTNNDFQTIGQGESAIIQINSNDICTASFCEYQLNSSNVDMNFWSLDFSNNVIFNPDINYIGTAILNYSLINICGTSSSNVEVIVVGSSAGIQENNKNEVQIYPNPTTKLLTILSEDKDYIVELKDVTGKVLLSNTSTTNELTIDLSNVNKGSYFLLIKSKTEEKTEKIIVQ